MVNYTLKTLGDIMKVVYGHTDSIYVQIDSVEKAEEVIKQIESSVREHFPNIMGLDEHPVVLEFEKYYSALGVGTTKNRNAGMITWKDGKWLGEAEFVMTGFTAKRVSETKLAKEVQTEVLQMWVKKKSLGEINKYLNTMYNNVLEGKVPFEKIIKRSRLKEDRFKVKCKKCHKRYNLNDCVGVSYCEKCSADPKTFTTLEGKRPSIGSGIAGVISAIQQGNDNFDDSYLYLKVANNKDTFIHPLTKAVKRVEYVAGSKYADFEKHTPDYEHYAQQVVKKAEPIYRAMDWDISNIRTGTIQRSMEEWL